MRRPGLTDAARKAHQLLGGFALGFLFVLLLFLASCAPCVSAYVVGCAPFPTAAPRQ